MVQKSEQRASRARGRPRQFDEAEVVAQVRDVFWANGYSATSLDDLVEASHVNRPSLYAAFGNKHALYLRVLEESRVASVDGVEQHLTGAKPLRAALYDFLVASADSTLAGDSGARGCFIVCTAVTEALRDAETRSIASQYVADVDRIFRERFERSSDELADGMNPATAAAVASAMLQTLAIRARTGSSRDELLFVVAAAVTAVCGPSS